MREDFDESSMGHNFSAGEMAVICRADKGLCFMGEKK